MNQFSLRLQSAVIRQVRQIDLRYLPFADAASPDLPLSRILRLALFQISIGMTNVLLLGTLNRVMIVELGGSASLVAAMVAIPFLFAPFRALVGFQSDIHRSAFGWRRVPYIWTGTLLQFFGLSFMPFALLVLSGDGGAPVALGHAASAFAFLLVGIGLHTTQTAGLALASDLATPEKRPRVVALLYVVLLMGMVIGGYGFSALLADFSPKRLIQVVQGAAMVTLILNVIALWKQEARHSAPSRDALPAFGFASAWRQFSADRRARRFLYAVGFGTAAFNMQDIILEPYGAEVLTLSVGETTLLTALLAGGSLIAFAIAARALARDADPYRLAAYGVLFGLAAFSAVIFAGALGSGALFRAGVMLIGFGGGLFAVGTLSAAMALENGGLNGLALGAWGAVQASVAGLSILLGGIIRDGVHVLASAGALGAAFASPATSYGVVYHLEILLLFMTLAALGPLVRSSNHKQPAPSTRIGLAEFPG